MSRIILEDVWYKNIVRGVSMKAENGVTAIIGPNGSGKTTILRIIVGALKPDKGRVVVPSRIGSSWQNPYYTFTKAEVIEEFIEIYGDKGRAEELLKTYNLESLKNSYTFKLSMGQARLISILIAISWGPEALVVDEPTNGLGVREKRMVEDLLKNIKIPVVIASHDLDFVLRVADYVYVLSNGRVVAGGPTLDVFYSSILSVLGFPEPYAVLVGRKLSRRLRSIE
ncbi:MAG: energy-coupling factor ABC transporter ATP-binding protein [Acidilobaceae archaeon]